MSSPNESDNTNSFEDAENGNTGEENPRKSPEGETSTEQGQAAQGVPGNTEGGITLSEDDIQYLMQAAGSKVDDTQPATHGKESSNPIRLPPPPAVHSQRGTDDEGLGASSTDGQSGRSSAASPNRPGSTRVSSTEVSPSAKSGGATAQYRPGQSKAVFGDHPPHLSAKGEASHPHRRRRYSSKEAEPVMAVGVANIDIDTASLAFAGESAGRGAVAGQDADVAGRCQNSCCGVCCCSRYCSREMFRVRCSRWTFITLCGLLVSVAVLCLSCFFLKPYVRSRIRQELVLRPGFEKWRHPQADIVADVYMFNLSNPDGFVDGEEIPALRQIGPYSFRMGVEKTDITWNSNGTVSYRERYTFEFIESRSAGSEDDRVWTVNIPLLVVDDYAGPGAILLNRVLSSKATQLIESHTIRELVWGYQSSVVKEIKNLADWAPLKPFHFAEDIPTTIGALAKDNSSVSKLFNVYTGAGNFSRLNNVYSWDYNRKLPYWTTEEANTISGTDGSVFKPFLTADSQLTFFCSQLFRKFDLEYVESCTQRGLNTLRFIIPDSQFFNSTHPQGQSQAKLGTHSAQTTAPSSAFQSVSSNVELGEGLTDELHGQVAPDGHKSGYCVPDCVPNGVYSIEPCLNAPLYISLPHFLGADPFYLTQVSGLKPQEDLHRPIFNIDSVTGVLVSNYRRYQLNVRVNAGKSGDTFLPVLWVDLRAQLGEGPIKELQLASKARLGVTITIIVAIVAVSVLFMVAIGLIVVNWTGPESERYQVLASRNGR